MDADADPDAPPEAPDEAPPRPLILDVDTGIDDMIALLIAATSPELNLRGVTCVAGNVEIHHVARNTGKILRMVGRGDVPVSIGAARPLQRRLRTAPDTPARPAPGTWSCAARTVSSARPSTPQFPQAGIWGRISAGIPARCRSWRSGR